MYGIASEFKNSLINVLEVSKNLRCRIKTIIHASRGSDSTMVKRREHRRISIHTASYKAKSNCQPRYNGTNTSRLSIKIRIKSFVKP